MDQPIEKMASRDVARGRRLVGVAAGLFCALGTAISVLLWSEGQGGAVEAMALALFVAIAAIALMRLTAFHPFQRFGPANTVTAARAALVCLLAALVHDEGVALFAFALTALALALDGVDGWLARRSGLASRFGARFDMEVDALLVLIPSIAAYVNDKAGLWVLLLGSMRYLFVAASLVESRMSGELPPSMRRKAICVLQIVVLALLLLPQLVAPLSQALAAAALVALTWSFAVDTRILLRRSGPTA